MSSFVHIVSGFYPVRAVNVAALGPAGLFVCGTEKAVPLRIRSVNSKVHCDTGFADTTETFAFISDEDVSVVFKFPLPPRSAVYKLEATIGDRTIITEVKPKHEAQAEFDTAVRQGHTAVIAKQEESTQIFTLELGNLGAMQEGIVTISYLGVLDSVGGALEWVHTSTWRPPYLGSAGDQQRGVIAASEQNPRFASQVTYSLAYDIELLSSRGINAVESPQSVTIRDEGEGAEAIKRVTLSEQVSDPSKDLTVIVQLEPADSGKHAVATADGYGQVSLQRCSRPGPTGTERRTKTVALATFVPRSLVSATFDGSAAPLNLELILIVDCSGSMGGSAIKQARDSALYFIKDLPVGRSVKFNILAFGSRHIAWSPSCQNFTADTMTSAVNWVQAHVHANLGGTEILGTLRAVYAVPITWGYTRQIIFLTDGGISSGEEQAVFELVSGNQALASRELQSGIQRLKDRVLNKQGGDIKEPSRPGSTLPPVLCLGIGHGVHRGLLDGMASRSGGVAQYVVDDESIVRKVALLSRTALSGPSAVCMPRLVTASGVVRAVPHVLPPRLFPDQPLHMLVELDPVNPATSLKLQGTRADGSNWEIDMPLDKAPVVEGYAYSVLHAMCYVSGLLEGTSHLHMSADGTPLPNQPGPDDVKASVVLAAVGAHLVTRHTAAVGVMIRKDPLNPTKVTKVEVPLAVPHGADHFKAAGQWGIDRSIFRAAAPAFSFANPAQQCVLFGSAAAPPAFGAPPASAYCLAASPSAFGAAPTSAFGSAYPKPSVGSGLFGASTPGYAPQSSLFSAPIPQSSLFRPPTPGYAAQPTPFGAPAFGAAARPTGGPFGAATVSTAPQPNPFGGTLGSTAPQFKPCSSAPGSTAAQPSLFGASAPGPFSQQPYTCAPPVAAAAKPVSYGFGATSAGTTTTWVKAAGQQPDVPMAVMAEKGGLMGAAMQCDDEYVDVAAEIHAGEHKHRAAKQQLFARSFRNPSDVLDFLNLFRGVEGSWSDSDELLQAVTSQVAGDRQAAVAAARAGKPSELSGEQWATVLALAFLRKHCAGERSVWEGMEAKAMGWLSAGWPVGARAMGMVVLAAIKLV